MLPQSITQHQKSLIQAAEAHNISYLALFGSYARGEQTQKSDVDFLVTFDEKKGLLDLIEVEQELSKILGIKVDLVTKQGLSRYIKPYIQDDLKVIYAKKS